MKRNSFLLFFIFLLVSQLYSEKWVGQIATFNLLPGTKMKNGDIFNSDSLNAACNGFRLGAKVNVINVSTGKNIEVTITDTISNDSNYFLLLTPGAAKELQLERETSLAVVDGSFTDVNTIDTFLEVNGLISEGSIDEEKIKKFPDIKWPDDDKEITKKVVEKDDKKDQVFNPINDNKNHPNKKENKVSEETELDLNPVEEKYLPPNKIMERYKISEDFDEKFIPKKDLTYNNPDLINNDKKVSDYSDDKLNPKKSIIDDPPKKNDKIAEDSDDKYNPKEEFTKKPFEKEKFLDTDGNDKINPKNEEDKKKPEQKKNYIVEDKDSVDIKKDDIKKDEKTPVNWLTKLAKNQIFVRFSTTFEKDEGERRFNLFKQIFKNVIAYQEGNRYILLIGPISEKEIDKTVKGLRSFGYKDAYVISNN